MSRCIYKPRYSLGGFLNGIGSNFIYKYKSKEGEKFHAVRIVLQDSVSSDFTLPLPVGKLRKHIKGCTLAKPAEQHVSTGTDSKTEQLSLTCKRTVLGTHTNTCTPKLQGPFLCQQNLKTTMVSSDVYVPTSPSRFSDTTLVLFRGCSRNWVCFLCSTQTWSCSLQDRRHTTVVLNY